MLLNKHQIFAADDLKFKIVNMQEWGGDVKIRVMTVGQQLEFDKFIASNPDDKEMAFYLIIRSCLDEDDKPLFNDDDKELLKNKSSESILHLFNEILELNKQQPGNVEDAAKNY